jgi:beta-N-acetylhexosaminidase
MWTALLTLMKTNPTFRSRVQEAARRVLTVKLEYLRGEKAVPVIPDMHRVRTEIPDPEAAAFFQDLAARSVTVIKDGIVPLHSAGRVLLAGRHQNFILAGRRAYPGAAVYERGGAGLIDAAARADTIIFCLENAGDLRLLESLRSLNKKIAVLCVSAFDFIDNNTWVDSAAALYSTSEQSFIAGFSFLLGRYPAGSRHTPPNPQDGRR